MLSAGDQAGKVYELAGDEAYTLSELAAEITRQSGRTVVFQNLPEADFKGALVGAGLPEALAGMLAESDIGVSKGGLFNGRSSVEPADRPSDHRAGDAGQGRAAVVRGLFFRPGATRHPPGRDRVAAIKLRLRRPARGRLPVAAQRCTLAAIDSAQSGNPGRAAFVLAEYPVMASSRPTMKSIAEELGVSRSTVSFVLAGEAQRRRINPETAARIVQRALELDFRPNYFAQALNTRKTGAIGLVFPDVQRGLHGADGARHRRGAGQPRRHHDAVLEPDGSGAGNAHYRVASSSRNRRADRCPCADFNSRPTPVAALAALFEHERIPVVCVDRLPRGWPGSSVVQDDRAAARMAVKA